MPVYRPKCHGEKPDDAAYLHREMAFSVFRPAVAALLGALVALPSGFTWAATLNQNLQIRLDGPQPIVVADRATASPDNAAEIVGRMLAPGASNPDLPLPHPGLSEEFSVRTDVERPLTGLTPFGRGETGGGVLGFRLPLPGPRGPTDRTTTSSP